MVIDNNPEKALIASYIIKLLNRDSGARVDRLLKSNYDEIRRNPLILDTMLRAQLMAYFSETGCMELTRKLVGYYRELELYSALVDAKNLLVICSKENISNSDTLFTPAMANVVGKLIENGKGHIVNSHVKSAIASCVLAGNLGIKFSKFMEEGSNLPQEVNDFIFQACGECQKELKTRFEESKPVEERK
jgi:hypothetical protein